MTLSGVGRSLVVAVVLLVALTATAMAGSVNLAWDSSPGATGYKVYSGPSPGNFGDPLDIGNSTGETINGMPDCAATHFAVSAYNSAGESELTVPISSWPRAGISGLNDADGRRGETLSVVLSGNNFEPGSTLQFDGPGIAVNSIDDITCSELRATITVQSGAAFGAVELRVVNTSGVASAPVLFSVVGDPLPDVQNLERTDQQQ